MRSLLEYVDFDSVVRLHLTCDRRMQTLLSTPGLVGSIRIDPRDDVAISKLFYAINFLRDVDEVLFLLRRKSGAPFIPHLLTLNPRTFLCSFAPVDSGLLHAACDAQRPHPTPKEVQAAEFLTPNGFLNLAKLTPRLQSIELAIQGYDYLDILTQSTVDKMEREGRWHQYKLPPTLTSFNCNLTAPYHSSMLECLPTSLRSLHLTGVQGSEGIADVSSIFERFQSLETLVLAYRGDVVLSNEVIIPKSLHTLAISTDFFPYVVLAHPAITQSSIVTLRVTSTPARMSNVHVDTLDLSTCLPPTIRTLRIRSSPLPPSRNFDRIELVSVPSTLTRLDIVADEPFPTLLKTLPSASELSYLGLVFGANARLVLLPSPTSSDASADANDGHDETDLSNGAPSSPFALHWISPTVTTLFLDYRPQKPLTKKQLAILPPNLTALHVGYFDFPRLKTLHRRYPGCQLHIYESIPYWDAGNGAWVREKFALDDQTVFDCDAYVQRLSDYFTKKRVHCEFSDTNHNFDKKTLPAGNGITEVIQRGISAPAYGTILFDPRILVASRHLTKLKRLHTLTVDMHGEDFNFADSLSSSLVELNIGNSLMIDYYFLQLPQNIKKFSASSHLKIHESLSMTPLNLDVLDTPNWYFSRDLIKKLGLGKCQVLKYKKKDR